jgi:RNA recognition motif-containing protein
MKSIYVGNLPFTASEDEVRDLFAAYGEVESVRLMTDRDTGRPRGFGFVKMGSDDAQSAIQALNGKHFDGRDLRVNEAEDRKPVGDRPARNGSRW